MKKKPPKYKKVSVCNNIEMGYIHDVGSPNNWFDIDSDLTVGNISISDFDGVWVRRGHVTMHVVPP